jgi:hypothetical protein
VALFQPLLLDFLLRHSAAVDSPAPAAPPT